MPISYEYEQMDTSVFVSCIRLLPTVLAGCPEGCNTSAYWGFLAHTLLCGSKNPLMGYGISRFVEISVPAPASIPSCIAIPVCLVYCETMFFFFDSREVAMDGWTKGGIDVVCWSVPSFQHTIYPPKSPSLFSLPLFPLIYFPVVAVSITSNGLWLRVIRSISSLRTALARYEFRRKASRRTTSILYTVTYKLSFFLIVRSASNGFISSSL